MIALIALLCGLPEVMWLGGRNPATCAGSAGMGGGTFMDRSAFGALENPAYACVSGNRADFTGSLVYFRESRTRTVYDSFGGVVGESENAFNQSAVLSPGGFAGVFRLRNWGVAAGARAVGSFSYDFARTTRDEAYVRTALETLECTGLLWEFGASAGWSPTPGLSVGAGGGIVTGSRNVAWTKAYSDPSEPDESWELDESISGAVLRASGEIVLERVRLAAGVAAPMGWNVRSGGVDDGIDDALEVRCGVGYLPGNRLRSLFVAEADWRDEGEPGAGNTWGIRGGVENHLPGGPVARFGFDYRTSPLHRALDTFSFTAGAGFAFDSYRFDAGLLLTPSGWRQAEVAGLPSFESGDSLSMNTLSAALVLGLSRSFGEVPPWR